jgi:hypothetical protein
VSEYVPRLLAAAVVGCHIVGACQPVIHVVETVVSAMSDCGQTELIRHRRKLTLYRKAAVKGARMLT